MAESILLVFTGLIFVVIGVAININAGLSPGGGGRIIDGVLILIGLWVFVVGVGTLFTGWVA